MAQVRGDAPMAPAATIGPVTDAPTFSVLGIAALPNGQGNSLTPTNDVWMGATQPLGGLGRVRFAALGSGNVHFTDRVSGGGQAQGLLTVRARARFGEQRLWSAVSYGRSSINGQIANTGFGNPMLTRFIAPSMPGEPSVGDTTITRRVDVGQLGRAEGGMVSTFAGVEFAIGMSFERATRVTTQTLTVDVPRVAVNVPNSAGQLSGSNSTLRTVQRRDLATGIVSAGFNTGQTQWLLSVTAPVASWISSDALAPRPQTIPTVASLAVVQPVTGWLSLVGAAATNAATVGGGSMLSDQVRDRTRSAFSPVVALGVRISRLPWRDSDGTPAGILAFETRTLGAVDLLSIEPGPEEPQDGLSARDTMRVVLLIDAPKAESVELMGDATQWNVTPMRRLTNGRWRAELKLSSGMHRITVRADGGQWLAPPGLPIGNDEFGSPVGMILVRR